MIPYPSTILSSRRTYDRGNTYKDIHRSQSSIELGSRGLSPLSDLDLFQDYLVDEPEDDIFDQQSLQPGTSTRREDAFLKHDGALAWLSGGPLLHGIQRSSTDTVALKSLNQSEFARGRSSEHAAFRPQKRPHPGPAHLPTDMRSEPSGQRSSTDFTKPLYGEASAELREQKQHHSLEPWTGHQDEDDLSQGVLRSGRLPKRLITDDKEESGTSRRNFNIGSHTIDDSCIRTVSAFFGRVSDFRNSRPCLSRRQPVLLPPSVTLTSKRLGQWFDRFADTTTPLQKSTRVLPRDLQARTLLDECLARQVPLARVFWLVRCISLNELSKPADRRILASIGDAGHRAAWIGGWTATVQGFVDDQISQESLANRKAALVYSLELSSQLVAEGLVADDQYMDWVIDRLDDASEKTFLFWLALARVHQPSISANVIRGNKLATSCVLRLSKMVEDRASQLTTALDAPLQSFVHDLLASSPSCFVFPKVWDAVRPAIERISRQDAKSTTQTNVLHIVRANDRLSVWTGKGRTHGENPDLELMTILDGALENSCSEEISTACLALMPARCDLTLATIAWACSRTRGSMAHLYFACRLFWVWAHQRHLNVGACLLEATKALTDYSGLCATAVGRLYAELTRSGHFDCGEYLRSAASHKDLPQLQPYSYQILHQAPFAHLRLDLQKNRTKLIASAADASISKDHVAGVKREVAGSLRTAFAGTASGLSPLKVRQMLDQLSASDLFDIGKWLKALLLPLLAKKTKGSEAALSQYFVELVLLLLDSLDDFAQLRDVMSALVNKSDIDSLHQIALCAEARRDVLAVLGHYDKVRHGIFGRYRSLRASSAAPHRALCRLLLQASNVAAFTAEHEQFLQREIDFCDPGIAAYTPLSEMDTDSAEAEMSDLDRLLAHGPSLEEEQLHTALTVILNHICQLKDATHGQIDTVRSNIHALRRANDERFTPALTTCIRAMRDELDDYAMLRLGSIILLDDDMELNELVICIRGIVTTSCSMEAQDRSSTLAIGIVRFLYGPITDYEELLTSDAHSEEWLMSPSNDWKRSVRARQLERTHPDMLVKLIMTSVRRDACGHADMRAMLSLPYLIALIHRLLRRHDDGFPEETQSLMKSRCSTRAQNLYDLIAHIVDLPERLQRLPVPMTSEAVDSVLEHLLTTVGPPSLQLYKLGVSWVTASWHQHGVSISEISEICYRHCQESSSNDVTFWHQLMASVDPEVASDMHTRAEKAILFCPESSEALAQRLQPRWSIEPTLHTSILNAIKPTHQLDHSPEKARLIARHLSIASKYCERGFSHLPIFVDWVQALLQLALIYHDSLESGSTLSNLLHSLCRLTTSTKLASYSNLTSLAYDTACFFAPQTDSASLAYLRTRLADLMHDQRIRFLLGGGDSAPRPRSQPSSNISLLAPSPALTFPATNSPTVGSSASNSFGIRKWDTLTSPSLDKALLDAAFIVWERYDTAETTDSASGGLS